MTSSIMYSYTINTGAMKKVFIYIAIVTTVLLNACTEDPEIAGPNKEKMKRVIASAASQPFVEANEVTRGTHRAMPAGYSAYSALDNPSIGLILTPFYTVSSNLIYVASESRWEGNLDIADDKQYYIYGFMPSNTTAKNYISAYADYRAGSESFADGAVMTVKNLKTLTTDDVCVIVGVKKWTSEASIEESDIRLGQFGYEGSANRMFLLFKHLYAGLHFRMYVDSEYGALRTIKVKRLTLTTAIQISTSIDMYVDLKANNVNADPVESVNYVNKEGTVDYASITLFPTDNSSRDFVVPVDTPEDFLGCFAPNKCNSFVLKSEYDIYDKKGNLIRENCVAENTINVLPLAAGELLSVSLKIQPTYLYQLSEPDMDNLEFVIE